jgi:hypothetical protein
VSYKGDVENKEASTYEPRELLALRQTTTDLYRAISKHDKADALALIDAIEREWRRANRL